MIAEDVKILLVEDDPLIVKMIQSILEQASYSVYVAGNGIQAIHLLEELVPHLIICDIMMPKMDGLKFRELIREDLDLQLVPFIFLTALNTEEDRLRGYKLDADDYITKPFEPFEFLARIQQKVSKYKLYHNQITYDALTQLYNRRFLMTQLAKELERVKRYKRFLSLIMIDIDTFKTINDSYGHLVGDAVLKEIARILSENIRDIDFAGRYGGEEFVIVMPEIEKDICIQISERLRRLIANAVLTEMKITVSFSGGIASAPEDGLEVKTLLIKADKALYLAKKLGKNRILPYGKNE